MNDTNKAKAGWKQKLVSEMIEYWLVVLYLACFLVCLPGIADSYWLNIKSAMCIMG